MLVNNFELSHHLKAVEFRHADIKANQIWIQLFKQRQYLSGILGGMDLVVPGVL